MEVPFDSVALIYFGSSPSSLSPRKEGGRSMSGPPLTTSVDKRGHGSVTDSSVYFIIDGEVNTHGCPRFFVHLHQRPVLNVSQCWAIRSACIKRIALSHNKFLSVFHNLDWHGERATSGHLCRKANDNLKEKGGISRKGLAQISSN